jgi:hypothetical protein
MGSNDTRRQRVPAPEYWWALRADVFRALRLRPVLWIFALAIVTTVGLAAGRAVLETGPRPDPAALAMGGADTAPFFIGLAALVFAARDFTNGAVGTSVLLTGSRSVVIVSKILCALALSAAITAAGSVVAAAAVVAVGLTRGWQIDPVEIAGAVGLAVLIGVFFAAIGAGIGLLLPTAPAVFVYLALVWAVPIVGAVVSIWLIPVGSAILSMSPVTLTTQLLAGEPSGNAVLRFSLLALVLIGIGSVRASKVVPR